METLGLGNIEIQFDSDKNRDFYRSQNEFTCDCPDCLNYADKIPDVRRLLKGVDETLGIDLRKAVGQGMDELMGHDRSTHSLIVVPYYLHGKCYVDGEELAHKQQIGPVMQQTNRVKHEMDKNLTLSIINTSDFTRIDDAQSVLTMWLEYKTELPEK